MSPVKHYRSVDLLKGICILAVIFTHCAWSDEERLMLPFPFWIDMAVPMFLILSGFVSTKSFISKGLYDLKQVFQVRLIISKFVQYTIPFLFIYVLEVLVLHLNSQVDFSFRSLLFAFLEVDMDLEVITIRY